VSSSRVRGLVPGHNFCLDHITYTGADATKQELRLAQNPLFYESLMPQNLPSFVSAALNLVDWFSGNPNMPNRRYVDFAAKALAEEAKKDEGEDAFIRLEPAAQKDVKKTAAKRAAKNQKSFVKSLSKTGREAREKARENTWERAVEKVEWNMKEKARNKPKGKAKSKPSAKSSS